jgi:hypothetical protein
VKPLLVFSLINIDFISLLINEKMGASPLVERKRVGAACRRGKRSGAPSLWCFLINEKTGAGSGFSYEGVKRNCAADLPSCILLSWSGAAVSHMGSGRLSRSERKAWFFARATA